MDKSIDNQIKEYLLKENALTKENLSKAESEAVNNRISLAEVLVKRNLVDFALVQKAYKELFSKELVDVSVLAIPEEVLNLIPQNLIRRHLALPYAREGKKLMVAMADPANVVVIDDLKVITGLYVIPILALEYQINARLDSINTDKEKNEDTSVELEAILSEAQDDLELVNESHEPIGDILRSSEETPVIKITNKMLLDSIKRGASDIFVEPWENMMRIRCRVDGLLEEIKAPPKSMSSALISRIKVMSNLDIAEHRLPQDGRFKIKFQTREVDFRVSVLPTSFGEKVCLRILDKTSQAQNLEKLGFLDEELQRIKMCAEKPHGMILVTGPTGSGKTSTLYSILNYLDSPEKNITTVEDPVEYMMQGINQVNCRDEVGLNFSSALRSILRQDPDIIMIGEIRDFETMDIAIKAALTGHLVLSTLHTNDATSAITRMVNMGIEPFLIASSVLVVSAQRLVRKLCQDCRKPFTPDDKLVKELHLSDIKNPTFFQAAGCEQCRDTGYRGRTVITEVFMLTEHIRKLIVEKVSADHIRLSAKEEGMRSLREAAIIKAAQGVTTLEEVCRVTAQEAPLEGKKK